MERSIPITKQQSAMIDALSQERAVIDAKLGIVLQTVALGFGEDLPPQMQQLQWRTTAENGVYAFHLVFPEPPSPTVSPTVSCPKPTRKKK